MPLKPLHACNKMGCPELVRERYCDKHKKDKQIEYSRYQRDDGGFYGSAAWKRLRAMKVAMNPLCEQCEKENKIVKVHTVDHIVPIKQGGAAYDIYNLQSLCRRHTDEKNVRDGIFGKK